jgi:hypothetical protein
VPEGATDKNTAEAHPDLKARLAAVRERCAALRGGKLASKADSAPWPRDLNAADGGGCWGGDPAEVRG